MEFAQHGIRLQGRTRKRTPGFCTSFISVRYYVSGAMGAWVKDGGFIIQSKSGFALSIRRPLGHWLPFLAADKSCWCCRLFLDNQT